MLYAMAHATAIAETHLAFLLKYLGEHFRLKRADNNNREKIKFLKENIKEKHVLFSIREKYGNNKSKWHT